MSSRDENHDRRCGAGAAAYALGALPRSEAEAFGRHLQSCPACTQELTSFRQVVNELPLSAARYQPPPGLRRRVLSAVASEPRPHHVTQPLRRARPDRRPSPSLPRLRGRTTAIVCAVAVVVVAAIATLVSISGSDSSQRAIAAHVIGPGRATLRLAHARGELIVHGLPAPPREKIYEVWLQRGHRTLPTNTLFRVTAQGDRDIDVPGSLRGVSRVIVTPEPLGGSRVPTHAPVIVIALT